MRRDVEREVAEDLRSESVAQSDVFEANQALLRNRVRRPDGVPIGVRWGPMKHPAVIRDFASKNAQMAVPLGKGLGSGADRYPWAGMVSDPLTDGC